MARATPLRRFAAKLAVLLKEIAKPNSILVDAALKVLNVSGLHALGDLLSQPTHLLLANQRRVEVVAVAAQEILVRITATAAEKSNAIVACAPKGLHLGLKLGERFQERPINPAKVKQESCLMIKPLLVIEVAKMLHVRVE